MLLRKLEEAGVVGKAGGFSASATSRSPRAASRLGQGTVMTSVSTSLPDRRDETVAPGAETPSFPATIAIETAQPDPLTEPVPDRAARDRLAVIDKLRGLVIVIMVLDHVRDFVHVQAYQFSPTNIEKTTAILFATRWVTHVCAPTFVFLAGVSVHLQWERGKRGWPLTRFLMTRGLWLIVLEVTVVTMAFTFAWHGALLQVIWAIGFSMLLLGALAWLPPQALLGVGLVIVCGHNLLDGVTAKSLGIFAPAWTLMLQPGMIHLPFAQFPRAFVAYPALPWFGIMAVGFGVGGVFQLPAATRDRVLLASGLVMLATFAMLRGLDRYGDPSPWTRQAGATRTVLSFLAVTKYPPSLLYTLATLGITLSLAPFVERVGGPLGRVLHVFGRTPLFTYLLHLYVARGLAIALALTEGLSPTIFTDAFGPGHRLAEAGWGVGLPGVYAVWLTVLLILWPCSTWYAGVKARRRDWWLGYL